MKTYTLSDFLCRSRAILCQACGQEMSLSARMDGTDLCLTLACPNAHRKHFEWPMGGSPPPEVLALLEGEPR